MMPKHTSQRHESIWTHPDDLWFALKPLLKRRKLPRRALSAVFRMSAMAHSENWLYFIDTGLPMIVFTLSRYNLREDDQRFIAVKISAFSLGLIATPDKKFYDETVATAFECLERGELGGNRTLPFIVTELCLAYLGSAKPLSSEMIMQFASDVCHDELYPDDIDRDTVQTIITRSGALLAIPEILERYRWWMSSWGKYAVEPASEL